MKIKVIRVYFFGDSICFGHNISIHKTWVARISARLERKAARGGCEIVVQNPSVNGNTTLHALERMSHDIESHRPDILTVQFGMNDCNFWESNRGRPRVGPEKFSENLNEIVNRALKSGVKKILLNTNHISGRDLQPMPGSKLTYQESNEFYNRIIREVAKENARVVLTDMENAFLKNKNRLTKLLLPEPDMVHLSAEGHALYFRTFYPVVEKAVLELLTE